MDLDYQDNTEPTHQGRQSTSSGTKASILMVDDEQELVELGRLILSHNGYDVTTCLNAAEALLCLKEQTFDLVISDVVMPEMNGYELSTEIMHYYPHTKIQLVSGYTGDQPLASSHRHLQQQLLRKPYKSSTLLQRIRELLGGA